MTLLESNGRAYKFTALLKSDPRISLFPIFAFKKFALSKTEQEKFTPLKSAFTKTQSEKLLFDISEPHKLAPVKSDPLKSPHDKFAIYFVSLKDILSLHEMTLKI